LALLVALSLAVPFFGVIQAAPKPGPPTAEVTFENGFDLSSDVFYGSGAPVPYANGVDNIAARFWAGGTGDLTLHLLDSFRKFHGTAICAPLTACSPPPNPTFYDGWFLNIHKISDMVNGETRLTQAGFIAEFGVQRKGKSAYPTQYHFNWCHDGSGAVGDFSIALVPNGCLGREMNGSLMVSVLRTMSGGIRTWTVSTDPIADTPVGPISEMTFVANNTATSRGLYHTSFRLTIRCQANSCDGFPE
jgi:hypothetical protein